MLLDRPFLSFCPRGKLCKPMVMLGNWTDLSLPFYRFVLVFQIIMYSLVLLRISQISERYYSMTSSIAQQSCGCLCVSINSRGEKKTGKRWREKNKQLSPLISGSYCEICFLLSGSCGCHNDEWGRNAERLYHSDGKHSTREEEQRRARGSEWMKEEVQEREDEQQE